MAVRAAGGGGADCGWPLKQKESYGMPPNPWQAAPARASACVLGLCLTSGLALLAGCGTLKQIGAGEHNPPAESFTAGGRVTAVVIDGAGGSIDVTGVAAGQVRVSQWSRYSKKPPTTRHVVHGSTLTLSYSCPAQLSCGVSYVLRVPRDISVQAHAGAGSITLTSLAGPVTAQTDAGLITAVDLRSTVARFKSNAGGVVATFSVAPETVNAATNLGSVTLTVPRAVAYKVTTHTYVGTSTVTVRRSATSRHVINASSDVGSVSVNPA